MGAFRFTRPKWPSADEPILHDIGYYMQAGGHGSLPADRAIFLKFMNMHLNREASADSGLMPCIRGYPDIDLFTALLR